MSRHHPAHYGIILIDRVYSRCFFFVADDDQGNSSGQFFNLLLKIRMRVAGINNSLRFYIRDHLQITFFQSGVSLSVTDKDTVSLFICHRFDSLQQQNIIRTCQRRAKNNDQFFFSAVVSAFMMWKLIPQFPGSTLYPLNCFFGKRNIIFSIEDHRYCGLGNTGPFCHLGGSRLFSCQKYHPLFLLFRAVLCPPVHGAKSLHQYTPGHRPPVHHWRSW